MCTLLSFRSNTPPCLFSFPLLVTGVLLLSSHSHQTSPFNCAFPRCLSQLSNTLLVQTSVPLPPREVTPKHAAFWLNGRKDRFGCTRGATQPSVLPSEMLLLCDLVTSIPRATGLVPPYSARMKSEKPSEVSCTLQPAGSGLTASAVQGSKGKRYSLLCTEGRSARSFSVTG